MLILRSRTLIPRSRDFIEETLLLLQDDASEADSACQAVIFTTQINPSKLTIDVTKHD